jgi:FtsH-binding integral membrane protein
MRTYERDYVVQDKRTLSAFVNRVYGWMSIGLGCTAAVAFFIYKSGLYQTLAPFWWVWTLVAFGIAMGINTAIRRASIGTVIGLFLAYASLQGILFGTILPVYAAAYGGSLIWTTFASASLIFGSAMCYGIFTKSDLTSLGRILSLALVGLIAISLLFLVLSFFVSITWMQLVISYLGLIIFVGLTAYDAQTVRAMSTQVEVHSVAGYKLSMVMALKMYINVIMIFWYLLQILSSNNRR